MKKLNKQLTIVSIIFIFYSLNLFSQNLNDYDSKLYKILKSGKNPKEIEKIYQHNSKINKSEAHTMDADPYFGWEGHFGPVNCVAYNNDGTLLASGGDDGTIRIWNTNTGSMINILTGHTSYVESVSFSPDGTKLASGSDDHTIKIWNISTGTILNTLTGHNYSVYSVSFSPDGTKLASGSGDYTVKIWNTSTGTIINTLRGHTDIIHSVSFSPDGTKIGSGSFDQTIKIWNVSTGTLLYTLTGYSYVYSVAFSPDGTKIASGNYDYKIKIWDVSTSTLINTLTGHTSSVWSICFSPDGTKIVSGSGDKTIKIWNVSTGVLLNTLTGYTFKVNSISFSPDGTKLASGSDDHTVKIWNISTGTILNTLTGHTSTVHSVSYSPDGTKLASGSDDNTIKIWNVGTGMLLNTLTGHASVVNSVAFSPDGTKIASGSGDATIKIWNVSTGTLLNTSTRYSYVYSVAFSPDGTKLASGCSDYTIKIWNVSTGTLVNTLKGHTSGVYSVSFSPDGTTLVSGGGDKMIKIWDVSTGSLLNTLTGYRGYVNSVSFSPDGTKLVSGGDDYMIKIWSVNTGNLINTLIVHTAGENSVAFSPDGTKIASVNGDETIKFWNASTGSLLRTIVDAGYPYSICYNKGGNKIAAGGWGYKNIRIYNTGSLNPNIINGVITYNGTGLSGVLVTISDSNSGTITTNESGNYFFNVDKGGNYTITPSKVGYSFNPASQTFNNINSNQAQNFTASIERTVTDIEGNVYHIVSLGTQVWMAENLKTTRYRNGDTIPNVTDDAVWVNLKTGAYCNYDNNSSNATIYGRLYNWYVVNDSRNIAPAGWHVANTAEWATLYNYSGGSSVASGKLKEAGIEHWASPNTGATNETGFTGLPSGLRTVNSAFDIGYYYLGYYSYWWSSDDYNTIYANLLGMRYNSNAMIESWRDKYDGFSIRCVRDIDNNAMELPNLITSSVTNINQTNVTCGGNITSDGGGTITAKGVCWSTGSTPIITDSKTTDGPGTGNFTSIISGLFPNTTYYIRAYATNGVGTGYGNVISFTTQIGGVGTVTDIDGNMYHTITIGTQVWMVENLKTTKYRNGDVIQNVTDNTLWSNLTTGAYCNYANNSSNVSTYGRMYNWFAVNDSRNIAPNGWHIPTDADWTILFNYLGGDGIAGGKLKEVDSTHWKSPNIGATNEIGFTALPGGERFSNGTFLDMYYIGTWWSSTDYNTTVAIYRNMSYNYNGVYWFTALKQFGYSVRCIRDLNTLTISGNISGASSVTVILSGSSSSTTSTNASGNYSFTANAGGNYTVTPSKTGYTFSPSSQTFTNVQSNQVQNFTTNSNAPTIPTLVAPSSSSTGVITNPVLSWNSANFASTYQLQVSTITTFLSTVLDQSNITGTSYSLNGLLPNTTYYWRVRSNNYAGTSGWSNIWSFTTLSNSITSVTLSTPLNFATDVPQQSTILWNTVPAATEYLYQIAEDLNFTQIKAAHRTTDAFAKESLEQNKTYYWKVRAENSTTIGAWSDVWRFTTVANKPASPSLISPSNNSTVKINYLNPSMTLVWNVATDASEYQVQVSEYANFSTLSADKNGIKNTTYDAAVPKNAVKYYWRVRGINGTMLGDWSEIWSFNTNLVGIEKLGNMIPETYSLQQNYPNPFNPETVIEYSIPENGFVVLRIYDTFGKEVETLVNRNQSAGTYRVNWQPKDLPSGVYYYKLQSGNYIETRKMLYIR